jgi:hypothetical protein
MLPPILHPRPPGIVSKILLQPDAAHVRPDGPDRVNAEWEAA